MNESKLFNETALAQPPQRTLASPAADLESSVDEESCLPREDMCHSPASLVDSVGPHTPSGAPASQCSVQRPCCHNDWDDVRQRKGVKVLRCRVCDVTWRWPRGARRGDAGLERCIDFLNDRCHKSGGECKLLHVRRSKKSLEERVEVFGDAVRENVAAPKDAASSSSAGARTDKGSSGAKREKKAPQEREAQSAGKGRGRKEKHVEGKHAVNPKQQRGRGDPKCVEPEPSLPGWGTAQSPPFVGGYEYDYDFTALAPGFPQPQQPSYGHPGSHPGDHAFSSAVLGRVVPPAVERLPMFSLNLIDLLGSMPQPLTPSHSAGTGESDSDLRSPAQSTGPCTPAHNASPAPSCGAECLKCPAAPAPRPYASSAPPSPRDGAWDDCRGAPEPRTPVALARVRCSTGFQALMLP